MLLNSMNDSAINGDDSAIKDVNEKLRTAAENGDLENVRKLVKNKEVDVNAADDDGYTALHRACYEGRVEVARFLLQNNANIEARTNDNWTPLHSACRWNQSQIASLLLHHGANVNAITNGKQTALHIAASQKDTKNIILLLLWDPNINVNSVNSVNETAYDIARRTSFNYQLFDMYKKFP